MSASSTKFIIESKVLPGQYLLVGSWGRQTGTTDLEAATQFPFWSFDGPSVEDVLPSVAGFAVARRCSIVLGESLEDWRRP